MLQQLSIDEEFRGLIPPLSEEEYKQLEQNLLNDGCLHELIVWDGTIIDGHNRYEICNIHKIPFKVRNWSFDSREDAKEWIIRNQFGRRNISVNQRSLLALQLDDIVKAKAKENKSTAGGDKKSLLAPALKAIIPIHTDKELAKIAGVSPKTIQYARVIKNEGTEEQKERFKKDKSKAKTLYKEIRKPKEDKPVNTLPDKQETKEEGGKETRVCEICGIEKPIEKFAKRYCKDCQKEITYARRDGITCDIENFKVDGNAILAELTDTKMPSEEGNNNDSSIVAEIESIVNSFCNGINPYVYMNGNLGKLPTQGKFKLIDLISKAEEWLNKIKILLEVK